MSETPGAVADCVTCHQSHRVGAPCPKGHPAEVLLLIFDDQVVPGALDLLSGADPKEFDRAIDRLALTPDIAEALQPHSNSAELFSKIREWKLLVENARDLAKRARRLMEVK